MAEISDSRRLEAWRERRDRDAMDALIRRNIPFVYGAARRILRDDARAHDVTQAVFLLLIQKSPRVPTDAALVVWLHRTTLYACANARRVQVRRDVHEHRAARTEIIPMPTDIEQIDKTDEREQLLPLLDSAMARLAPRDRSGVILCYFQRRSFREIGAALGTTEEAARKRVSRAIDRMRESFASRGIAAGSMSLAACLTHQSTVVVPPALVEATANIATLSQLISTTSACTQIVNGVLHTMLLTKVKAAAAILLAVLLITATTGFALHRLSTAAVALADDHSVTAGDLQVEFLGLVDLPKGDPKAWFAIDGGEVDLSIARFEDAFAVADKKQTRALAIKITTPNVLPDFQIAMPNAKSYTFRDFDHGNFKFLLISFTPNDGVSGADAELSLAEGEWKELCSGENTSKPLPSVFETDQGTVIFVDFSATEAGGSKLTVIHDVNHDAWRVVAIDDAGAVREADGVKVGRAKNFQTAAVEFGLPLERIAAIRFETRPYNWRVIGKNLTLDPAKPTKPTIEVNEKR